MLVNNKDDDMEICVRKKLDNNIDYQLIKVNYSKKEKLILEKKFSEIELKEIQLFQRDIILDGDRFKLEWVNGTRMRLCLEWGGNDLDEWKGVQELTNYLLSLGEIE
ncbi:MAG: hypothetical protein MI810_17600 [Flavobacteriales bacterium]|nr:hypothetical protein [Flavobacteriales bacterium]